jgi:hypothetical protein
MGWGIELQRRVIRGDEDLVPDWADLGKYTVDGLKYLLVIFIWYLPFMALWVLMFVPFMLYINGNPNLADFPVPYFFSFFPFLMMPFFMLLTFLTYAVMPIITGLFAVSTTFKDAFDIRKGWALLKVNFWQCLGAAFLTYMASYVIGMVGMFLFFVGIFFLTPVTLAIMHYFFGMAYKNALIKLSQAASEA